MSRYLPREFWEQRLARHFDLRGTGHIEHSLFYNRWLYRAKARAVRAALRLAGRAVPGAAVLDVGCGTGFFLGLYRRWGAGRVAGADITAASVQRVRAAYPGLSVWEADIAAGIPTEELFDIVQALDVFYHLPDDRFAPALGNLVARARPGGVILISDGLRDARLAPHVALRSRTAYTPVLHRAGAAVIGEVPMYRFLNRGRPSGARSGWPAAIAGLSDAAAPLLYLMDRVALHPAAANLFLLVCRRG